MYTKNIRKLSQPIFAIPCRSRRKSPIKTTPVIKIVTANQNFSIGETLEHIGPSWYATSDTAMNKISNVLPPIISPTAKDNDFKRTAVMAITSSGRYGVYSVGFGLEGG
jgi:hypothetical protein